MRRALLLGALLCASTQAQLFIDANHLPAARRAFDALPAHTLACQFQPLKPALGYSFRFLSGYFLHLSLGQFGEGRHSLVVLARVTPEGGEPRYMVSTYDLPEKVSPLTEGEIYGGFVVGEGRYTVTGLLLDDQHRECRAEWHIEAKLDSSQRHLHLAMEPGTIGDLRLHVRPTLADTTKHIGRLTVLMHAAPMTPDHSKLSAADLSEQMGSLSALLEQLPADSVRLVVFNLDQQKVLLRDDNLGAEEINRVARTLNELQLGTVPLSVVQNTSGAAQLLSDLLNAAVREEGPSDVVVILGPLFHMRGRIPDEMLLRREERKARLIYLQFHLPPPRYYDRGMPPMVLPRPGRPDLGMPPMRYNFEGSDVIEHAVGHFKGQTILVSRPAEFAEAIKKMQPR